MQEGVLKKRNCSLFYCDKLRRTSQSERSVFYPAKKHACDFPQFTEGINTAQGRADSFCLNSVKLLVCSPYSKKNPRTTAYFNVKLLKLSCKPIGKFTPPPLPIYFAVYRMVGKKVQPSHVGETV